MYVQRTSYPLRLHGVLCRSTRFHPVVETTASNDLAVLQSPVLGCNIPRAWRKQFTAGGKHVVSRIFFTDNNIQGAAVTDPVILVCCHQAWQSRQHCCQVQHQGPLLAGQR
jgi:hypothetical protein